MSTSIDPLPGKSEVKSKDNGHENEFPGSSQLNPSKVAQIENAIFNWTVAWSSRENFLIFIFSLLAFRFIVITWREVGKKGMTAFLVKI